MMWGMGLIGLLVIVVLLLGAAALVNTCFPASAGKTEFCGDGREKSRPERGSIACRFRNRR